MCQILVDVGMSIEMSSVMSTKPWRSVVSDIQSRQGDPATSVELVTVEASVDAILGVGHGRDRLLVSVHSCESHSWPYSVSNLLQYCPFLLEDHRRSNGPEHKTTAVCLYILVCSTATGMSPARSMSTSK